jgi:hypothetical protein
VVLDAKGWADHDARLPVLQGASRGLQFTAIIMLPLLGCGSGLGMPMLTRLANAGDSTPDRANHQHAPSG